MRELLKMRLWLSLVVPLVLFPLPGLMVAAQAPKRVEPAPPPPPPPPRPAPIMPQPSHITVPRIEPPREMQPAREAPAREIHLNEQGEPSSNDHPEADKASEPDRSSSNGATTSSASSDLPDNSPRTSRARSNTTSSGLTGHPGAARLAAPNSPEAEATLGRMNTSRAQLKGVNRLPIPEGHVTSVANGGVVVRTNAGRSFRLRANGTLASVQGRGQSATFRADGRISSLRTPGLSLRTGPRGQRVITSHLAARSMLVSTGRQSGYLERSVERNGKRVMVRTYLSGKRIYRRTYVDTYYHGRILKQYVPAHRYSRAFYAWVVRKFPSPIHYKWGWAPQPWYIYYAPYYIPWPVYEDAGSWLTDYFLGGTLEDGYYMQQPGDGFAGDDPSLGDGDAAPDTGAVDDDTIYAASDTPITPEVKQAIAAEVQDQLSDRLGTEGANVADVATGSASTMAQAEQSDLAQIMKPGHVFVVSTPMDVSTVSNQRCGLSPGDVLSLVEAPDPSANRMSVVATDTGVAHTVLPVSSLPVLNVVSGQKADCPAGTQVRVAPTLLEEMQNNFRARLDDGLQILASQHPKSDLPTAPPSATSTNLLADVSAEEPDIAALLQSLQTQADQAEAQFTASIFGTQAALPQRAAQQQ